jgi:ribosomal protein L11 methyltransferase
LILQVGRTFVVFRGQTDPVCAERLPIALAHGPAFGSGEHETTRSCLEELELLPVTQKTRVLDLGCGTGVLAVGAARLGAASVLAIDPSVEAYRTTLATVGLNGMHGSILPVLGDIGSLHGRRFDLVMANLYGDLLIRLMKEIVALLAPQAYLLLSGISDEYAYDVRSGFESAGCDLLRERRLDEYTTFSMQFTRDIQHG